jgi:hypothetical protein
MEPQTMNRPGMSKRDESAELVAAHLRHAIDLLRSELNRLESEQRLDRELAERRLAQLEKLSDDHELRLRSATDGVTSFKVTAGLASGASGLVSLFALLKSFLGG